MSGKIIEEAQREEMRSFQVDYFCRATGKPGPKPKQEGIKPFDHLKRYNIIEYKSIHEVLNEQTFRHYVGRALAIEGAPKQKGWQGQTTLTILTTRLPSRLLSRKAYGFEEIHPWKFRSTWIDDMDIVILVQRRMRGFAGGDGLALLQVLEGDPRYQQECWREVLSQDLITKNVLKKVIMDIDEEVYMSLVEELKEEGRVEGRQEGRVEGRQEGELIGQTRLLLNMLRRMAPDLFKRYEANIRAVRSLDDFARLESQISKALMAR
jgi:hypothetical protein